MLVATVSEECVDEEVMMMMMMTTTMMMMMMVTTTTMMMMMRFQANWAPGPVGQLDLVAQLSGAQFA